MAAPVTAILFARYTTLAGVADFRTFPVDVEAFGSARFTAWRGVLVGASAQVEFSVEVSNDKEVWFTLISGWDPGEVTEVQDSAALNMKYLRATATLVGAETVVSVYMYASLEPRRA